MKNLSVRNEDSDIPCKADVDSRLNNVPNVKTNDQTPTYSTATTLAKLVTGEKLGVAFGKIAKAVDELITHLSDGVKHITAAERTAWNNKAAEDHTHSNMTAATASAAGKAGFVPAPAAGTQGKYLRGDGTWQTPPDTNTTYSAATQSAAGLMSADDKKKLDGIASGAQVNTDSKVSQTNSTDNAFYRVLFSNNASDADETAGVRKSTDIRFNPRTREFYSWGYARISITNQTIDLNGYTLAAGRPHIQHYINTTSHGADNMTNLPVAGQPFVLDVEIIRWASTADYITQQTFRSAADQLSEYVRFCINGNWGVWRTRVFTDTKYSNMTAATDSAAGKAGLVPAPVAGAQGKYLRGDGTWQTPPDTNTTYSAATQSAAGLMSATDKKKLDSGYVVKSDNGGLYIEI